ncbi:DrmB family protein [Kitasatospora purpeofusca]|uniref:DrmB family protein n=1 Tax=Kitasatospora purpeofusca TaxID=67352 RepID=UPI003867F259|nr:DUF1998 domain-containing protein [Kitasatospora purpeofusca]
MATTAPGPRCRVGSVRPSHLMFTAGVGSLVDLPNFAVQIRGLDDWRYDNVLWEPLAEPRLLEAVRRTTRNPNVAQLRPAPWMDGLDSDPNGPAGRIGVPTIPFPAWFRCTACNTLAALDTNWWTFENSQARRPDLARYFHNSCSTKRKKPLAVTARFMLSCTEGHLDEFPYQWFVHRGDVCQMTAHPTLSMEDHGGNQGANVTIRCTNCRKKRNMNEATGDRGLAQLPSCRGRHPHLGTFKQNGCTEQPRLLVVGASNQWFARTLTALAVPATGQSALAAKVAQLWDKLQKVKNPDFLEILWDESAYLPLHQWEQPEVYAAIAAHRATLEPAENGVSPAPAPVPAVDLLTPEWEIFTTPTPPDPTADFTLLRDPAGVPEALEGVFSDVVQVERLREVRALVGFTRLDAPDPEEPDLVKLVDLARDAPTWVPASEVRGEGIFLRLSDPLLSNWHQHVASSDAAQAHREAYQQFRHNRYSDRIKRDDFNLMDGWPGLRYLALHTLSHLLIRTIALECGYSSASLSERIYAGTETDPRSGILIYTAVPDAEGTLGGLVSLAEPQALQRIVRRAWHDALRCSSDPLCAERLPQPPADFLHGAACHACLFVSETTCERGNRFLDRRFIVPIGDDHKLALIPGWAGA